MSSLGWARHCSCNWSAHFLIRFCWKRLRLFQQNRIPNERSSEGSPTKQLRLSICRQSCNKYTHEPFSPKTRLFVRSWSHAWWFFAPRRSLFYFDEWNSSQNQVGRLWRNVQRRGRPPISPKVLLLVLIMQFIERLSDRAAADNLRFRIDWKISLNLELDFRGIHATTPR